MEKKEELKKELERLTVEKVEVGKSIAKLIKSSKPYIDLKEDKKTIEVEVDEESKDKYEEIKKLRKREADVYRKWKEVLTKFYMERDC